MSDAPINREYLTNMSGDDLEFEKELVEAYLGASPELLAAAKSGVEAGNAAAVCASAHTLKGSSRAIGAEPVAAVAESLEKKGHEGDVSGAEALVHELHRLYAELQAFAGEQW